MLLIILSILIYNMQLLYEGFYITGSEEIKDQKDVRLINFETLLDL